MTNDDQAIAIRLEGLRHVYGKTHALRGIDMEVPHRMAPGKRRP
jgi:ABC-type branched-subunit amino acid transport system ATPase component